MIRELRKASGMTAVRLADRAGLSQSQLSKIETGKATISIKILEQLCQVLQRPLSYLFQSEEDVPRVLGTLITVAGPESEGVNWFAEEVRRRTGNRMSLIPLRPAQLGPAADQVEQLRQGVLDLFIEDVAVYHKYAPALSLLSLPYAFRSNDHLASFLTGSYFHEQARQPLLQQGIRFLNRRWNWLRGLEWVLVSTRPVFHPNQVEGMRIRIYDSEILAHFWRELGAEPVVVPWPEVKSALRRGLVDAVPTHKAHVYPLGFCRYARYVSLLGDICPALGVVINEHKYRCLPPPVQQVLEEACDVAGNHFTALVRAAEEQNEALNISRFQAAYLKIDLKPWQEEAERVRKVLAARGALPAELIAEIDRLAGEIPR